MLGVVLLAAASAAAATTSNTITRPTSYQSQSVPRHQLLRSLLSLRGGVRELVDHDDWEALQEEVCASGKLLVVDFTAVWCGPCQRIAPAYAALADEFADRATLVKCDVDVLGDLAAELGVTSMPTFLFFRDGEVIDSMRGADEAGLRALVAEHADTTVPA